MAVFSPSLRLGACPIWLSLSISYPFFSLLNWRDNSERPRKPCRCLLKISAAMVSFDNESSMDFISAFIFLGHYHLFASFLFLHRDLIFS